MAALGECCLGQKQVRNRHRLPRTLAPGKGSRGPSGLPESTRDGFSSLTPLETTRDGEPLLPLLPQKRRRSTCCGQARITRQPGSKEEGDKQYKGTQVLQCGCQATRGKNKTVPSGPSQLHSCQKTAISRAFSAPRSNLRVSPQASRDQDSSLHCPVYSLLGSSGF